MNAPLFSPSTVHDAFAALRKDLIHPGGPRISTMRNYRFAIVLYDPADEFKARLEVQRLAGDVKDNGWTLLSLDLQKLFLERVRAEGEHWAERVIEMERKVAGVDRARGLNYLKSKLTPLIEGPEGLAADCSRKICETLDRDPEKADRTVVVIGRAGSLYPFFRSSALLRHLDGRTRNVPVILLYPGKRKGPTALSFMDRLEPDNDYRPRIYP